MSKQGFLMTLIVSVSLLIVLGVLSLGWFYTGGQAEESPRPTPLVEYREEIPPTATVAPNPTQAPGVAGTALYATSFESEAALNDWTFIDLDEVPPGRRGVWTVEDGHLVQDRTEDAGNPSLHEVLAVTGPASWTDYTVSTNVYHQKNPTTFGLVARRQGNSFYRYRIITNESDATPKQILEKVVDGVATPLVEIAEPGYDERRWYSVSLSVVGSNIQVTLDGKVVAEATDSTLTSGQAGLFALATGDLFFDDVTITSP